ncbi:hypothetical protein [Chryseobacterium sp.]|uniref:hypothetical protein n=1 Tax=Chryseobacterium sp. TaxID=1871047 RepID=UPI002FC6CBA3
MRNALKIISSKKAEEIVLMNKDSIFIERVILKCIQYPMSMGNVPKKAKVNPLITDLSNENRLRIFFLENKIFNVIPNGIKLTA